MGKGVLLEVEGRRGIVLTPDGAFMRVPLPKGSWEVGAEIQYADSRPMAWTRWGVAAAAALILTAGSTFGYQSWALAQPVAIVTVDINPSLSLTLNKRDEVLQARGLNADGTQLLAGANYSHRPLTEVVEDVTEKAIAEQKLDPADSAGLVVVAVTAAGKSDLPAATSDRLVADANHAVSNSLAKEAAARHQTPAAQVFATAASVDEREQAAASGLTPGKWMIYQAIQEQVPNLQPDVLKAQGPGAVLKDLGISPSTIIKKAEQEHGKKDTEKNHEPTPQPNGGAGGNGSTPANSTAPANGNGNGNPPTDNAGPKDDKGKGKEQQPPAPKKDEPGSKVEQNKGADTGNHGKSDNAGIKGNKETEKGKAQSWLPSWFPWHFGNADSGLSNSSDSSQAPANGKSNQDTGNQPNGQGSDPDKQKDQPRGNSVGDQPTKPEKGNSGGDQSPKPEKDRGK